jgi:crotonobetainyl-CoA:carnitine CoA-transferase CaiB-like acyl-CoA transferase
LRLNNLNRLDWQFLEHLAEQIGKPKLLRAIGAVLELAGEEDAHIVDESIAVADLLTAVKGYQGIIQAATSREN